MTYKGRVKNGVVVLEDDASLAEDTEVRVETVEEETAKGEELSPLAKTLLSFAGIVEDLPPDASINHDHYLYGTPKHE